MGMIVDFIGDQTLLCRRLFSVSRWPPQVPTSLIRPQSAVGQRGRQMPHSLRPHFGLSAAPGGTPPRSS